MQQDTDQVEYVVRSTPPFRLKDRAGKKRYQGINLKTQFGFIPEVIIVELMPGTKDVLVVRAVVPESEMDKEENQIIYQP